MFNIEITFSHVNPFTRKQAIANAGQALRKRSVARVLSATVGIRVDRIPPVILSYPDTFYPKGNSGEPIRREKNQELACSHSISLITRPGFSRPGPGYAATGVDQSCVPGKLGRFQPFRPGAERRRLALFLRRQRPCAA